MMSSSIDDYIQQDEEVIEKKLLINKDYYRE